MPPQGIGTPMPTAGPTLVFEAAEQGSVVMAQLAGMINEDNALDERLTAIKGKGVLIDLANIERINSCGVRDWIRFAQRLEAAGNALYLLRCSPVVVAQLNMVRNFCGERGHVVSFQAPYFCPNCDEERTETFESSKLNTNTNTEPAADCPTCGSRMEFDDLPDLYFAFARIHGGKTVPPEVQSAAARFQDGPAMKKPVPAAAAAPPAPAPQAVVARPSSNPSLNARPPVGPPPLAAATAAAKRPSSPTLPAASALPAVGAPGGTTRPSGPKPAAGAVAA